MSYDSDNHIPYILGLSEEIAKAKTGRYAIARTSQPPMQITDIRTRRILETRARKLKGEEQSHD